MNEKNKLQKLFFEKKYSEIIKIIEETKSKSAGLLNLLGVCKLYISSNSLDGLISANLVFQESYLMEKNTKFGLDGLINFINTSIELYDFENDKFDILSIKENFEKSIKYFTEMEKIFPNDVKLILSIIRLYKRLGNLDLILFYQKKLININYKDPKLLCSYIYRNCFNKTWKQNDFYKFSKILNDNLKKYPDDKLIKISKKHNDKIRLGFLSSDLKNFHSITYFLKPLLKNYDKNKFDIFLVTNNKNHDDSSREFINHVNGHIDIFELSDIDAINSIRDLKIDIMFDLMGVTSSNRLVLFKNRIANVQITWLGYCNTTGTDNMDYIIADPNLIKNNEKHLYSEKILFLPEIWNCHEGFKNHLNNYSPPFKKNKYITFCSFNNFNKINEDVIKVWSEILKTIHSKLILKSSIKIENDIIKNLFKKYGVLNLVEFKDQLSFDEHLNLYKEVDIALDTFPYNGVTTSFEALWMSVPVLTMKGYNFNSRCGESILKNIGLNYLIAQNPEDYFLKATELSNNIEKLEKIRKDIFSNVKGSPLFNYNQFSQNFYSLIESIVN